MKPQVMTAEQVKNDNGYFYTGNGALIYKVGPVYIACADNISKCLEAISIVGKHFVCQAEDYFKHDVIAKARYDFIHDRDADARRATKHLNLHSMKYVISFPVNDVHIKNINIPASLYNVEYITFVGGCNIDEYAKTDSSLVSCGRIEAA